MLESAVAFFKESYEELRKVSWLGRQELIASTIAILILVAIFSVFVACVDFICLKIVGLII